MANTENKCANVKSTKRKTIESVELKSLLSLQKKMQKEIYGLDFEGATLNKIASFWLLNKHSIEDELGEMLDALGGIDDGIGSAVWKNWKSKYKTGHFLQIKDLSEKDLLELKFEVVDVFIFFLNFVLSIGMTGDELLNLTFDKTQENVKRQLQNY